MLPFANLKIISEIALINLGELDIYCKSLISPAYKNKDDTISQQCHPLYNQNSSTNCGSCTSLSVAILQQTAPGAALSRLLCLHRLGSLTIKAIVFLWFHNLFLEVIAFISSYQFKYMTKI